MMTMDYHDFCQAKPTAGQQERTLSGIADFTSRLLERSGYRILEVPYTEFGVNEKLLKRIQFLEARLKKIDLIAGSQEAEGQKNKTVTKV